MSYLARKINAKDYLGSLALERNRGLGVSVVDVDRGVTFTTPAQEYIWRGKKKQALAEEMRVLYVALTRARERLVLSGTVKDLEKNRERWTKLAEAARPDDTRPGLKRLTAHQMNISAPGGLMDWIGAALTLNPEVCRLHPIAHDSNVPLLSLRLVEKEETGTWHLPNRDGQGVPPKETIAQEQPDPATPRQAAQAAMERIEWVYPHTSLTHIPARMTTSDLKRRTESLEADSGERLARVLRPFEGLRNPFAETHTAAPDTSNGAERGIATHLVLQHVNLLERLDYVGVSAQVDRMMDRGLLTETQREWVNLASVAEFFASELGRRVLAQPLDRVWRETPFVLGLSPSLVDLPDSAEYDETERIRVQGVLDCLIEEDDGLVLIDYKTDRIPPEALLARATYYRPQIRLYARAVEAIYPKPLKEGFLYFLHLGAAVPVWPEPYNMD